MIAISEFPNLENKKILFIAETHFQFMNCINIAYHTSASQCDLFINEMYKDVKEYANKIERLGLFRKIETYSINFGKIEKLFRFLVLKKYIFRKFKKFDYDIVFFASRDFLTRCVVTYCKYIKPSIHLISYDEGLGTYISRMESYTNVVEKTIVQIIYHNSANIVTDKILYKPEAYIGESKDITLYRMPSVDSQVIRLFNQMYEYDDFKRFNSKVIFFDNYYDGTDTNKKVVLECLIKKTEGKLLIKKHPQTPDGVYDSGNVYQYSDLPYEIMAANDSDIQNKILVTIMSTAVWTPALMFNQYPKIVLLYPLFDNEGVNDAKRIIEKMTSLYLEDRVVIVTSYDELKELKL